MTAARIAAITDGVLSGRPITREQAEFLAAVDEASLDDLLRGAAQIRVEFRGQNARCCSIVSVKTGRCGENCAFCSQSGHFKTHVQGLTNLQYDEVMAAAEQAAADGAESFGLVASGYGPSDADLDEWAPMLAEIAGRGKTRACGCFGVLNADQAQRLAGLGVRRYNHNLQTSRRHFPNIITTHSYDERLQTLRHVREAGMSVCSGALFGMGETWADRLDLAFELAALDVEVVPVNFLIPIDGTPLAGLTKLSANECLRIIAVMRFCLPHQEIKIAGGRELCLGLEQDRIFAAGADSFLIGNYLTTCGREPAEDRRMVAEQGLELASYTSPEPAADQPAAAGGSRPARRVRLPVLPHAR